jgi:predicted alpha/beta-fold hydrolase
LFEDYQAHTDLLGHTDILAMHEDFVPRFSNHATASSYFRAYALNEHNLKRMDAPCHIVMVEDDPIIPVESSALLPKLDGMTLQIVPYGGHCGFLSGYHLNSWIDGVLVDLFC